MVARARWVRTTTMNTERDTHDEDRPDEPGAEGGASESATDLPGAPSDDDAPAGDTDQHSSSDA
jgi:hypothetical protein